MTQFAAPGRDLELQGHYAGAVTRLVAYLIDSVTLSFLFAVGATVFEFVPVCPSGWDSWPNCFGKA